MESSDESELSGDEDFDEHGEFDLITLDQNTRENLQNDSSDSDSDFEGFQPEDAYMPRQFDNWVRNNNPRNVAEFTETVGPTRVLGAGNAADFFQIFYGDEVFSHITRCTNANANQKRATDPDNNKGAWTDVTVHELQAFYGMLILMDVMKYDRDELYWRKSDTHFLVSSKMPEVLARDRFAQIKRYLHYSENDGQAHNDKLHKIRYILDHCREKFQAEYIPNKYLSADEAMVPFKGRLGFKQFMKDKPVRFGVKLWVLADAISAYCYNFEVYIGKDDTIVNRNLGLAAQVVIGLTKPVEMRGHVVFMDNFYTSLVLADYLYTRNTYLCGTMRPNRLGFPRELRQTAAETRRLQRGASDFLMCGPILSLYWKDNRVVYYVSTYHEAEEDGLTLTRTKKNGTQEIVPCPPAVKEYGKYMGGVDHMDQMTIVNKSKRTRRWYRRVEMKLRKCSLYNAYILEGQVTEHNPPNRRKRDFLDFRLDCAHQLITPFLQGAQRRPFKRRRSAENENLPRLDCMEHWPVAAGGCDRLCVVCNRKHKLYISAHPGVSMANNPMKRSKTTMMCEKCDVPLCCNSRSNCFKDYHTKVFYWQ